MTCMPRDLDFQLLRTFSCTARLGNVTAAAAQLNLTQSTVSQQLKRLEELLGRRLLERDHRGARLTADGARALVEFDKLLAAHDAAWRALQGGAPAPLRLGLPPDLMRRWLPDILRRWEPVAQGTELSLHCTLSIRLVAALERGELDVVVAQGAVPPPAECLGEDELVWVGAADGQAHRRQPLPVSIVAPDCAFRVPVQAALLAHGRDARFLYETGDIEATTTLVRSDHAVTVWMAATVPADLRTLRDANLPALPRAPLHLLRGPRGDGPAERLAGVLRDVLRG
jgi:DNA-binding transcriptional LysR family regulator